MIAQAALAVWGSKMDLAHALNLVRLARAKTVGTLQIALKVSSVWVPVSLVTVTTSVIPTTQIVRSQVKRVLSCKAPITVFASLSEAQRAVLAARAEPAALVAAGLIQAMEPTQVAEPPAALMAVQHRVALAIPHTPVTLPETVAPFASATLSVCHVLAIPRMPVMQIARATWNALSSLVTATHAYAIRPSVVTPIASATLSVVRRAAAQAVQMPTVASDSCS